MAKNKRKKQKKPKAPFRALVFFLLVIAILLVSFGGIYLSAYSGWIVKALSRHTYLYQLGMDNLPDTTTERLADENLFFDGVLCLCMEDIAKLCGFTVIGDALTRTYFPTDTPEEYVTFSFDSDLVEVKGEVFRMSKEMFVRDQKIYVPASFFQSFCSGLSVTVDEEKSKITVCRVSVGVEYNALDQAVQVYQPIEFLAQKSEVIQPMDTGAMFGSFALPSVE